MSGAEKLAEPPLWLDEAGKATMKRHFEILLAKAGESYFGPFFLLGALEAICDLPRDLSNALQKALSDSAQRERERRVDPFSLRSELERAVAREDAERKRAEKAEGERNALTDRVANLERGKEVLRAHLAELRALLPEPNGGKS